MYNFDEIIDRRNTSTMNTDGFRGYIFHADETKPFPYKDEEFIRVWVAGMEFTAPDVVIDGIRERLDRRIFGYTRVFGQDYSLHPVQPSHPLRAHLAGGQAEEAGRHHQKAQPLGHLRRNPLRPDPL